MSAKLHDLPNNAVLGVGATPRSATATVTGSAIDMITGDGQCCALQLVGTIAGTSPTLAGKIQESADGTTSWADVISFTTVSTSNVSQMQSFERTKRYVRYVGTIGGTSPTIPFTAMIIEQKKQVQHLLVFARRAHDGSQGFQPLASASNKSTRPAGCTNRPPSGRLKIGDASTRG